MVTINLKEMQLSQLKALYQITLMEQANHPTEETDRLLRELEDEIDWKESRD